MEREHYCTECGDLREAPGTCAECVAFELVDRIQAEAAPPMTRKGPGGPT